MKLPPLPTCNYGRDTFQTIAALANIAPLAAVIVSSETRAVRKPGREGRTDGPTAANRAARAKERVRGLP